LLCLSVFPLRAQVKKEPPSRKIEVGENKQQALPLPDIALPEFVVTGKSGIELPDSYKSEPTGARFYAPDADEAKLIAGERDRQAAKDLNPVKRSVKVISQVRIFDGVLTVGYGNYSTPLVEAIYGKQFNTGDISLRAGYKSSDGHKENADYSVGNFGIDGGYMLASDQSLFNGTRLGGVLAFSTERYRFYGAPNDVDRSQNLFHSGRRRTKNNWESAVTLTSDANKYFDYALALEGHLLSLDDVEKASESQLGAKLEVIKDVNRYRLKGSVDLSGSNLNNGIPHNDPVFFRIGLGARRLLMPQLDMTLNLNCFLYRNFASDFVGRLYPQAEINYFIDGVFTLSAGFTPGIQQNSLYQMVQQNGFLMSNAEIRHQDRLIETSIGLQADLGTRFKGRAIANYARVRDYPMYRDTSHMRVWDLSYEGTSDMLGFSVEGSSDVTKNDEVSGNLTLRSSNNSVTDRRIPYFANVELNLMFQHTFPFRLVVSTSMIYVGTRYTDLINKDKLDSYALVDIRADYQVLPRVGVFLYFSNILNQSYYRWDGYLEVPFFVMGGMRFRW
jgi:hypothetical protein